jgi:N-acetylglucosamine-6-phosphate deacetylase
MITTLTARRLLTATEEIAFPVVRVEDGAILEIAAGDANDSTETLTPTFLDIHVHGACTHDFMAASGAEIAVVGRFLARHGVGHYLPTTVTGPQDLTLHALERLADAIESGDAEASDSAQAVPVGIHLEGPFVSHVKRGVHPPSCIVEPSVELFERFQQAARGHIRLMTMAPELPRAGELIAYATATGVRVSMGHSNATVAETQAASFQRDAGAGPSAAGNCGDDSRSR